MVTGVIPSPPRFLPSIFIAHRVQQSHCSSIVHRMLLTHALALSASQFVHKKKSQRICTSMHSAGLELTKLTYTRLEDNLIRHRGDWLMHITDFGVSPHPVHLFCSMSTLALFIVSVHRLIHITLLTLIQASSKGTRQPISFNEDTHPVSNTRDRSMCHVQLAEMSFDEIVDLTAEVYFELFVIIL